MIMNYNDWFYEQHKYLTGNRDGVRSFNDTKWVDMNKRLRTLIDMGSSLLGEQPFGVVGNNTGFDKLMDLIGRSNYSFEDLNQSLIDTYHISLRNAMSRQLVNSHAVICRCTNADTDVVTMDKFTHYYIIDVPFNQLHFGDRDEFIRQKLSLMHNTENGQYLTMSDIISQDITSILGFSFICTVNGFICNDFKVAIDDKGLKFKIGWLYSTDVEFIIYKLDEAIVKSFDVRSSVITNDQFIPYSGNNIDSSLIGRRCIVNIYDKNFVRTSMSVPNFGEFTEDGLKLINLQDRTIKNIENNKSTSVTVVVYVLKYLHELPNVYPAVNYYDIMDTRRVFTDDDKNVSNVDGDRILSNVTNNVNKLEVCTPPIVLDRPVNLSFKTILDCLDLYGEMMEFEKTFRSVGSAIRNNLTGDGYSERVKLPIERLYTGLCECYTKYLNGAILTSLVPSKLDNKFHKLIDQLDILRNCKSSQEIQRCEIPDEFYGDNYIIFVNSITSPFRHNALVNFADLRSISNNYFTESNHNRFNRPISEQCFITLKYNRVEGCWLFAAPTIKHFKGIGNTFYIDDGLVGDEVFKFLVLYTDTESPTETEIPDMDIQDVFDFDMFCEEVDKHIGYIRYWDAENRLLKISKTMYGKYDGETCVQVLSKILKNKISGSDILDTYMSDINYEPSNITSDNVGAGEEDERAPFAINFLFYTLSMLYNNEDKLQSYFLHRLTSDTFYPRYIDLNIDGVIDDSITYPINYSQISIAPDSVDLSTSVMPETPVCVFYGLPYITSSDGSFISSEDMYRYTFNVYDANRSYHLIDDDELDQVHHVQYSDPSKYGHHVRSYRDDIQVTKLMSFYLNYAYSYISELQTNYRASYNQSSLIESCLSTINKQLQVIKEYIENESTSFDDSSITPDVVNHVVTDNSFVAAIRLIKEYIDDINNVRYNNRNMHVIDFFNQMLSVIHQCYVTIGFDNFASKRIQSLHDHLRKINTEMNPYQFKKWLENFDHEMLKNMDSVVAENENFNMSSTTFKTYYNAFMSYKIMTIQKLDMLDVAIKDLMSEEHFGPIIEYVNSMMSDCVFDMYVLNSVTFDADKSYDTKPYIVRVSVSKDEHFNIPTDEPVNGDTVLIFKPITNYVDGKYRIRTISKVCEYAFFNGDDISDCMMEVVDIDGNVISSSTVSLSFIKIGSSADGVNTFEQIPNINSTAIGINHTHESFDVDETGMIINKSSAEMNYEMFVGNHFKQLNHETELVFNTSDVLPGPTDIIHVNNQTINDFSNMAYGNHISHRFFFKPSQVIHPMSTENNGTAVGGKYFVGQHLYLSTIDKNYVFPVIVTAIDHSRSKGFVEAVVDHKHAKWFRVDDNETLTKYLTSTVECVVIDDNISNFLDEFTDTSLVSYPDIKYSGYADPTDETFTNAYSLPGDPLFVTDNAPFVYNRLNWFFGDLVPNRFIDDEHKRRRFIYIGDGFIHDENDMIQIKMVNHNFTPLTLPEQYPILREEPNDHMIWDEELKVFHQYKYEAEARLSLIDRGIARMQEALSRLTKESEREELMFRIESEMYNRDALVSLQKRMDKCIAILERPTTWYNVRAYQDALVYISNGRAKLAPSFVPNIRDIPFDDNLEVFIYDWENKSWLDPSLYTIEKDIVDAIKLDEYDDYSTWNVLHSIKIKPTTDFIPSNKLLVYLSYESSDVFDNIQINPPTCSVRFKPILSLDHVKNSHSPYNNIRIRKHFDGVERYMFDDFNPTPDFSVESSFHIKRPRRSGKYVNAPVIRLCDLSVLNGNKTYDFTQFDLYVKMPFADVSTRRPFRVPVYSAEINQQIDSFVPGQRVKLICIQNNELSMYDGNISNIMFEGITSFDGSKQSITISSSSLPNIISGTFICTVLQDDEYITCGGIITIDITFEESELIDENDSWIKIPTSLSAYRKLPEEFIIVPNDSVTIDTTDKTYVLLSNTYVKDCDDTIDPMNSGTFNPFEYYFDTVNETRLPISDVRRNAHASRLVVDTSSNPDIKLVKSTYVGICRYSAQRLPKDGFVDLTGYIPTPLSRSRYEFWMNGRCITDPKDVVILSPTSIQLCNMTSLRNFEVIELVDDVYDSVVTERGTVYIDLNGNTFSSYKMAMSSNHNIIKQDIRYTFNNNQHHPIHDSVVGIIENPNNTDDEKDILVGIESDEQPTSYSQLYNIPSINGISLLHQKSASFGIVDIPTEEILDMFDDVWKREILTNPVFKNTHRTTASTDDDYLNIRVIDDQSSDMIHIYATGSTTKYFTLYISKKSDGLIDDVKNTVKIIPFIRTGVHVMIDRSYSGMWVHATTKHYTPIQIQ